MSRVSVVSIWKEFERDPDDERDSDDERSDWQWYGTVRVRVARRGPRARAWRTYEVGVVIGVPDSEWKRCRDAQAGVRPWLAAWWGDASDWQASGLPDDLAAPVLDAIQSERERLWIAIENRRRSRHSVK